MNNSQKIKDLLDKLVDNTISAAELDVLGTLLNDSDNSLAAEKYVHDFLDKDEASEWKENDAQSLQRVDRYLLEYIQKNRRIKPFISRFLRYAAAILVLFTGLWWGYYLYSTAGLWRNGVGHHAQKSSEKSIKSGKYEAQFVGPDGLRISLETLAVGDTLSTSQFKLVKIAQGTVAYLPSLPTDYGGDGVNVLEVPRGGEYKLLLEDGTAVWLNAESTLKFPLTFIHKKRREVSLTGEGYFEVSKRKIQPFQVLAHKPENPAASQVIRVLGTHFNVNTYAGKTVRTTLIEGKIALYNYSDRQVHILVPGQEGASTITGIIIQQANLEKIIDWKNNKFIFKGESIHEIMEKIARWYNIEYDISPDVSKESFYGTMNRSADLDDVLKTIELTGLVHFKIEGRRVSVMP